MKPNGSAIYHTIKRPSIQKSNRHGMVNRNKDNQPVGDEGIQTELRSILKEIRVITNKIRAEVELIFYIRQFIFFSFNIILKQYIISFKIEPMLLFSRLKHRHWKMNGSLRQWFSIESA